MERTYPPEVGDERTTLLAFLAFFRDSLAMEVEGMSAIDGVT